MRSPIHACANSCSGPRLRAAGLAAALIAASIPLATQAQGTWAKAPPNTAAGGQAFGLWLLTDGRILSHGSALNHWVILTPDRKGDYSKGTWKDAAASVHARGGAQQQMLNDGRFFQIGGEYVDGPACTAALCVSGEIYDPIADKWTDITPAPMDVGDTGTAMLDNGRILVSTRKGSQIQIYDATTDKWTMQGTMPLNNGQENAWSSLQNGGVLAVGYAKDGAAIYDSATGTWKRTGAVPSGFDTGDTGGISLMFDGRVYVYGLGKSYIYTPGNTGADPGTWALGPDLLNGNRAEDEFSDTLPNGKVWGGLVQMTYGPGVVLQEFDPETNMSKSVTPPPDMGNPYPIGYINLPNGQVMVTCERNDWIYTSDTQPKDEWRPIVNSVTFDASSKTYTLTGTQLSGLINGADEGDDMSMAENYPIVYLTNEAGDIYYCRSFNFSHRMPHKGDLTQTCQFTTPADLPEGDYGLYVSAVGVQSKEPVMFTVGVGGKGRGAAGSSGGSAGSSGASGAGGSSSASNAGAGGSTSGGGNAGAGAGVGKGGASGNNGGTGLMNNGAAAGAGGTTASGHSGSAAAGGNTTPESKSGCGCHVVVGSARSSGWLSLALLAVAWFRTRERRRAARASAPASR